MNHIVELDDVLEDEDESDEEYWRKLVTRDVIEQIIFDP